MNKKLEELTRQLKNIEHERDRILSEIRTIEMQISCPHQFGDIKKELPLEQHEDTRFFIKCKKCGLKIYGKYFQSITISFDNPLEGANYSRCITKEYFDQIKEEEK